MTTMTNEQRQIIDMYLSSDRPTYSEIGAAMGGMTRNQIAGVVSRNLPADAPRRGSSSSGNSPRLSNHREVAISDEIIKANGGIVDLRRALGCGRIRAARVMRQHHERQAVAAASDRTKPKGCRFPYGDPREDNFHYCQEPQSHGSYCAYHYSICYRSTAEVAEERAIRNAAPKQTRTTRKIWA